jgi:RimJ/RimL family protein N-acetyltransferase
MNMKEIETERLILREWQDRDLDVFSRINQDPKVLEFLPAPLNLEETAAWIDRIKKHFSLHGFGLWAAELKSTGKLIGYVGLSIPSFEAHFTPCVEIGWRLGSEHWGYGYATEAAKAVLKVGFDKFGLDEIVSFTVPTNERSIHVMEKIGMKRDFGGDFSHPKLPKDHLLSAHVLFKIKNNHSVISFKPLAEDDLLLLHQWFQMPHVFQWYARGNKYTLDMIREKYLPRIKQPENISSFIIYIHNHAVGYIHFYSVNKHLPDGVNGYDHALFKKYKPEQIAGIDIFIADGKYLNRGYGSKALSQFINKYVKEKFQALVSDSLKSNRRAILFFKRNGFESLLDEKNENNENELMLLKIDNKDNT